jgi:hypothetical protein
MEPDASTKTLNECSILSNDIILLSTMVIYGLLCTMIIVALHHAGDYFFIQIELRATGIAGLVSLIVWVLLSLIPTTSNFSKDLFPITTLWIILFIHAILFVSTLFPLALVDSFWLNRDVFLFLLTMADRKLLMEAKRPNRFSSMSETMVTFSKTEKEFFDDLLASQSGYTSFKKFLIKEFSVENLLFWKAVEEFRMIKAVEEIRDHAVIIFHNFLEEESPFQVNVPGQIVNQLRILLNQKERVAHRFSLSARFGCRSSVSEGPSCSDGGITSIKTYPGDEPGLILETDENRINRSIFDNAQREIFYIMEKDYFPRFRNSRLYSDHIEQYA